MPSLSQRWTYWILAYLALMAVLGSPKAAPEALWLAILVTVGLQLAKLKLLGKVKSDKTMLLTACVQTACPALVFVAVERTYLAPLIGCVVVPILLVGSSFLSIRNEYGLPAGIPLYGVEASVGSWYASLYVFTAAHLAQDVAVALALIAGCGLLSLAWLRNTRFVVITAKSCAGSAVQEKVLVPGEKGARAFWQAASLPSVVVGLVVNAILLSVLVGDYVCSVVARS